MTEKSEEQPQPTTVLKQDYVRWANSASHFKSGDVIEREAKRMLEAFNTDFPREGMNAEQIAYLTARDAKWREFVLKHYNDYVRRRSQWVPWTVSGPANYPVRQMKKRADKMDKVAAEFQEKVKRFYANTRKELNRLTPQVDELDSLKTRLERMEEKLRGLDGAENPDKVNIRAIRREVNLEIHHIQKRIVAVQKERAAPPLEGWTFDGGEMVINSELDRLQILFDDRPDDAMIAKLKGSAFKWSPRNQAWQRQLTKNAHYAAKQIVPPRADPLPE